MRKKLDLMNFVDKICSYSPRLGENEKLTATYIKKVLSEYNTNFKIQKFKCAVPKCKEALLKADGKFIRCKGCSLVSGKITEKNIINSLDEIDETKVSCNINFNPLTKYISIAEFYNHPAVAIKYSDLNKIIKAKEIEGEVKVEKFSYASENIFIGNIKNPKYLIFSHYDCIGNGGAVDNASGISVAMYLIITYPELLDKTLLIFSGCEEISYDKYNRNGLGFRKFEETFSGIIRDCKKIYVLDGIGNGNPHFTQNYNLLKDTLQFKCLEKIKKKVFLMQGDIKKINEVYHTDYDVPDQLNKKYLIKSAKLLYKEILKFSDILTSPNPSSERRGDQNIS